MQSKSCFAPYFFWQKVVGRPMAAGQSGYKGRWLPWVKVQCGQCKSHGPPAGLGWHVGGVEENMLQFFCCCMKTVKTQKQVCYSFSVLLLSSSFLLSILYITKFSALFSFLNSAYFHDDACKMLHSSIYTSHVIHPMACSAAETLAITSGDHWRESSALGWGVWCTYALSMYR